MTSQTFFEELKKSRSSDEKVEKINKILDD